MGGTGGVNPTNALRQSPLRNLGLIARFGSKA